MLLLNINAQLIISAVDIFITPFCYSSLFLSIEPEIVVEVEVSARTSAPSLESTLEENLIPVTPEDDEPEPGYDYEDFSGDADERF